MIQELQDKASNYTFATKTFTSSLYYHHSTNIQVQIQAKPLDHHLTSETASTHNTHRPKMLGAWCQVQDDSCPITTFMEKQFSKLLPLLARTTNHSPYYCVKTYTCPQKKFPQNEYAEKIQLSDAETQKPPCGS